MKKALMLLLAIALLCCCRPVCAEESGYRLDRVVILSRHNIRSPLSGSGSMLGEITPHEWFQWTSSPSELSLRGAVAETMMGQYFRLWLEQELAAGGGRGSFLRERQTADTGNGPVFLRRPFSRGGDSH